MSDSDKCAVLIYDEPIDTKQTLEGFASQQL